MYPRGSDRGWHRGQHQWDGEPSSCNSRKTLLATPVSPADSSAQPVPVLRGHHPRSFRGGGYNAHREHGGYNSAGYHDYHDNPRHDYHDNPRHDYHDNPRHDYHDNPRHDNCHDYPDDSYHMQDYDDRQFQDYKDPRYHDERNYHEYREPGYHRGRAKGNHYRGGYKSHERGNSAHNKHSGPHPKKLKSPKIDKTPKKGDGPAGRSKPSSVSPVPIVVHNPGRSVVVLTSGDSSTDESKEKTPSPIVARTNNKGNVKPIPAIKAETSASNSKSNCEQAGTDSVTIKPVSEVKTETIKVFAVPKEEIPVLTPKEEEISLDISAGKRPHPEQQEASLDEEKREHVAIDTKRMRNDKSPERCNKDDEVQIPLLDGWIDVPPHSSGPSCATEELAKKPELEQCVSDTAQMLRRAFILARKEEIELAYAQDCRTFALVANMLLKKDPSIETAVASALRSTLQEIAGRCVHELNGFIERYDVESRVLFESAASRGKTN
ncbi:periphilin-1-like isoform X2 [Pelobates fuscus]